MADGIAFPNGMAVTPDDATLIAAESYANRLTAFDIAADGSLSNRRVWADLHDGVPDGIRLDAEGAIWYGDVPHKRCVRVREGGEVLQTLELDRGCFCLRARGRGPQNAVHDGDRVEWSCAYVPGAANRAGAHHSGVGTRRRLAVGPNRPQDHIRTITAGEWGDRRASLTLAQATRECVDWLGIDRGRSPDTDNDKP
jgi:hypothetical protein